MDPEPLVTAYTTSNTTQAEVIRLALEDAGIPCQVGFSNDVFNVTGLTRAEILVHARDLVSARDLIQSHSVEHGLSDEQLEAESDAEGDDSDGLALDEEDMSE